MSDIQQTFAAADAVLKALVEQRAELAEVVAKPMPATGELEDLHTNILALSKRVKATLDSIAPHETALRGLDRALIILNNDDELAARDKRLRTFESERLRIEILQDEAVKFYHRVGRQIEVEEQRPYLLRVVCQYNERLAKLEAFDAVAEQFEELLEIATEAARDAFFLRTRHKTYPEIAEGDVPYTNLTSNPEKVLNRLAKRYTSLVDPKPVPKIW